METTDTVSGGGGLLVRAPIEFNGDYTGFTHLVWDEFIFDQGSNNDLATSLIIRSGDTVFGSDSTLGVVGDWRERSVDLVESEWTRFAGLLSFEQVLANVTHLFVSMDASTGGNPESSVDNIALLFSPEPSVPIGLPSGMTYLQPANPLDMPALVDNPIKLDLDADLPFLVEPGDYLRLQAVGDFDFATDDDNTGGPFNDGTLRDVWGVFSSSDTLEPEEGFPNRVPDAIDYQLASDLVTSFELVVLDPEGIIPDIPDDFLIPSITGHDSDGIVIKVPERATHLFLGAADIVWSDNTDPNGSETEADYGVEITRLYAGRLSGDYDFDGDTDGNDFLHWQRHFGSSGVDPIGDGNFDGTVDDADLQIWSDGHATQVGLRAIPEPSSLCLLLLSLSLTASRKLSRF